MTRSVSDEESLCSTDVWWGIRTGQSRRSYHDRYEEQCYPVHVDTRRQTWTLPTVPASLTFMSHCNLKMPNNSRGVRGRLNIKSLILVVNSLQSWSPNQRQAENGGFHTHILLCSRENMHVRVCRCLMRRRSHANSVARPISVNSVTARQHWLASSVSGTPCNVARNLTAVGMTSRKMSAIVWFPLGYCISGYTMQPATRQN